MNRVARLSSILIKSSISSLRTNRINPSSSVNRFLLQHNYGQSDCGGKRSNISSFSTSNRRIRRRKDTEGVVSEDVNKANEESSDDTRMNIRDNVMMVKDKSKFLDASHAFLIKAAGALEPMKAYNDVFNIQISTNERGEVLTLSLKPSDGQYVLQVDNELLTLSLLSPMSGSYTYVLCKNTNVFVGMEDGHSLEGMIVRDLIRHCQGLPNF